MIAASECQKLIEGMPGRVQAVLKARGGGTQNTNTLSIFAYYQ